MDNQDQADNPDLLDQRVQAGLKATEDNLERMDRRDLEESLAWLDHQEELEVREHLGQPDYKYKIHYLLFSLMYIFIIFRIFQVSGTVHNSPAIMYFFSTKQSGKVRNSP